MIKMALRNTALSGASGTIIQDSPKNSPKNNAASHEVSFLDPVNLSSTASSKTNY
jgi:hypothetical protein